MIPVVYLHSLVPKPALKLCNINKRMSLFAINNKVSPMLTEPTLRLGVHDQARVCAMAHVLKLCAMCRLQQH